MALITSERVLLRLSGSTSAEIAMSYRSLMNPSMLPKSSSISLSLSFEILVKPWYLLPENQTSVLLSFALCWRRAVTSI